MLITIASPDSLKLLFLLQFLFSGAAPLFAAPQRLLLMFHRCRLLQRSLRTTTGTGTLLHRPLAASLAFHVRGRANYMASSTARSPVATGSGSGGRNSAPPPPSSPLPSATSTAKISSCRTAQIARHFSTSSSPTGPVSKQKPDMASNYTVRKVAAPNTLEHRVYVEKDGQPVSPFHDIPLYANQEQTILNMVVEIPRWTNAKLEVCFSCVNCYYFFPRVFLAMFVWLYRQLSCAPTLPLLLLMAQSPPRPTKE